jgi:hypothetical protein
MRAGDVARSTDVGPTIDDRVVANPVVLCVRNEGDTVLLNTETGRYFGLNPVGTDVWDALLDGRSLREIVALISTRYDTAPTEVQSDVLRLTSRLLQHNLVGRSV